ncbi:hypothetical protein MJO29_006779 [Puccinia striiformis f. sp. tritici]|nr:hypothetical protein MJO29_006779 [Puccinia striiformis f. sp. tritici]
MSQRNEVDDITIYLIAYTSDLRQRRSSIIDWLVEVFDQVRDLLEVRSTLEDPHVSQTDIPHHCVTPSEVIPSESIADRKTQ